MFGHAKYMYIFVFLQIRYFIYGYPKIVCLCLHNNQQKPKAFSCKNPSQVFLHLRLNKGKTLNLSRVEKYLAQLKFYKLQLT